MNILLNSIIYEKIALEVSVFEGKVYENVLESLTCKFKIIELTDELKFKENIKKKKNEIKIKKLELNKYNINNFDINYENLDKDDIFNYDKCIICDEFFSKARIDKKNKKINDIYSSSSEDNEALFNFNSENVQIESKVNINNNINLDLEFEKISKVHCPLCKNQLHTSCFAEYLLEDSYHLIPKEGVCLVCSREFKWSEFLMKDE